MSKTQRQASRISQMLRDDTWTSKSVAYRVEAAQSMGYQVERVRHNGSKVGSIYTLKCGEVRIAIDAPRGLYRTAFCIILDRYPTFAKY